MLSASKSLSPPSAECINPPPPHQVDIVHHVDVRKDEAPLNPGGEEGALMHLGVGVLLLLESTVFFFAQPLPLEAEAEAGEEEVPGHAAAGVVGLGGGELNRYFRA